MASETAQPGFWARVQRASVERLHIRLESLLVLVLLSAAMAMLSPFFLSLSNFLNILLATSTIGVLAIAATFVIGSGGLDLSLGSVMGLAGVAGAFVAVNLGWPSVFAVIACILAGAIAGYINGQLVVVYNDSLNPSPGQVGLYDLGVKLSSPVLYSHFELDA